MLDIKPVHGVAVANFNNKKTITVALGIKFFVVLTFLSFFSFGSIAAEGVKKRVPQKTDKVQVVTPEFEYTPCGDKQLDEWAKRIMLPTVTKQYKILAEKFSSPKSKPISKIKICFRNDMGGTPAWVCGDEMSLNPKWIKSELNGEALGCTIHELMHIIQSYPGGAPGWFVEGLADYVRWYCFEPEKRGCKIYNWKSADVKYNASYRISANFLNWIERSYGFAVLKEVDAACRARRYRNDMWKELTGLSLQELDAKWKSLKGRPISPSARK